MGWPTCAAGPPALAPAPPPPSPLTLSTGRSKHAAAAASVEEPRDSPEAAARSPRAFPAWSRSRNRSPAPDDGRPAASGRAAAGEQQRARTVPPSPRPCALLRRPSELTSTGTTMGDGCSTENSGAVEIFQQPAGVDSNSGAPSDLENFGCLRVAFIWPPFLRGLALTTACRNAFYRRWSMPTACRKRFLQAVGIYRRLALTTARRNSSIEAVVNTTRLYKDFCNFLLLLLFSIFLVTIFLLHIDIII